MIKEGEKSINREKFLSRQEKQKSKEVTVDFTYDSKDAKQVYLVGEFNNWEINSIPMRKITEGKWEASITLKPGSYEYKYFADGDWVDNGPAIDKAPNSFGSHNLVMVVK